MLNLALPPESVFHVSAYAITLIGKDHVLRAGCRRHGPDLGYGGILSLGHGLFFALGGYAFGTYPMRQIGRDGSYGADLPDFMVFLEIEGAALALARQRQLRASAAFPAVALPAVVAFVFGYFAFRSRIKGVYFSIITQALTYAAMLLFFRNETGFGGNNTITPSPRPGRGWCCSASPPSPSTKR